MVARVIELTPEGVVLDFNHPLAGQRVTVKVKVLGVEAAED
jgi:FKBP-type peptidyl-prolyl cis-trans isomerase 2